MKDAEINIAIAEQCGWSHIAYRIPRSGEFKALWGKNKDGKFYRLPDYCNDLNAMQAEKTLRNNQFHYAEYPRELFWVVTGHKFTGDMGYFLFNFTNATARQRAEAFLRTIGKWRDV